MNKFWKKHKEAILYILFGGATTAINIFVYFVATAWFSLPTTGSNIIAWILSVIFAFITNKLFVFESKSWAPRIAIKESVAFFVSRLLSGVLDVGLFELLLLLGLNHAFFGSEGFVAKILVNIVVIAVNYILSKLIIFRKQEDTGNELEKSDLQ